MNTEAHATLKKSLSGLLLVCLCWAAVATPQFAVAAQDKALQLRQAELEKLRARLGALRDDLQKDIRKRDQLGARLRDAEQQEAAAAPGWPASVKIRNEPRET